MERKWSGFHALGIAALGTLTGSALLWNVGSFNETFASKFILFALGAWAISTIFEMKFLAGGLPHEVQEPRPDEMTKSTILGGVYLISLVIPFVYSLKLGVLSFLVKSVVLYVSIFRRGNRHQVSQSDPPILLNFLREDFAPVQGLLNTMARAHSYLPLETQGQQNSKTGGPLNCENAQVQLQRYLRRDYDVGLQFMQTLIEKPVPERAAFLIANRGTLHRIEDQIVTGIAFLVEK